LTIAPDPPNLLVAYIEVVEMILELKVALFSL